MGYILFTEVIYDICNHHNTVSSISIGTFIILAIVITYLPQYIKIIKSKSTNGISYNYLLLGNISNFTNFFGSLLLNYQIIDCCSHTNTGHCINILLPIYQMFFPWLCIFVLYIIFLIYNTGNDYRKAFISFTLFILIWVVLIGIIGLILIIHYQSMKNHVTAFGNTLNIISTITCIFTFLPQLMETYRIKSTGSLSIISLAFQAPGSFLVFFYQNIILKTPFTIGFPYLISGILQTALVLLSYYYERINSRIKSKENTPLIINYQME